MPDNQRFVLHASVLSLLSMKGRFWRSLLAVLLGNALYFSIVSHLPERARHAPYQIDLGLAVDFWICLVFYGLLGLLKWFRPPSTGN
jgi:hypothetical protein